jgi:DNA-binding transcriptional MerR regulator
MAAKPTIEKGKGGVEKAPDAFRTISEVADDLDIPQHVLRFWESRFSQIRPMKRGGGRRYYRPEDVALLRGIRHLLYGQGYTIRGVQRILREQGIRFVQTVWEEGAEQPAPAAADAEPEADETAEDIITAREPMTRPTAEAEPRRTEPDERREPSFAPRAAEPTPAAAAGLTAADRQALQAVMTELADCRRLLAAALDDAG